MSGFNPGETDGEKKCTGTNGINGKSFATLATFARADFPKKVDIKLTELTKLTCKKSHENCENSEKSHFSQCVFLKKGIDTSRSRDEEISKGKRAIEIAL